MHCVDCAPVFHEITKCSCVLGKESPVEWGVAGIDEYQSGIRLIIKHSKVRWSLMLYHHSLL